MNTPRIIFSAASLVGLALLAGCQMGGPAPTPVAVQPRSGVEGSWVSTDGVSVSTFSGGTFVTTATDTGNKLAEGSYRHRDSRTVEITMTSLIRQTTSAVNCALVTPSQLNCTSATGAQFVLVRRT